VARLAANGNLIATIPHLARRLLSCENAESHGRSIDLQALPLYLLSRVGRVVSLTVMHR
jgi:hypothetical protein